MLKNNKKKLIRVFVEKIENTYNNADNYAGTQTKFSDNTD